MAAAVLAAAVPVAVHAAPADAAQLTVAGRCFVAGDPIAIAGSGFTPGAPVTITGALAARATADAAGSFSVQARVPAGRGVRPRIVSVGAFDGLNPRNVAPALRLPIVPDLLWGDYQRAISGPPREKTTWHFTGFAPRRGIYGHFLLRGRLVHTYRFGVARGACGTLAVRARRVPVPAPRAGRWTLQMDQSPRYRAATEPRRRLGFDIERAR